MQTRRGIYVNPQQKVRCQTRQGIRVKKMTSHHQIMTERNNLKRKAQDTRNYKAPKRSRNDINTGTDHFEALPDDLVIAIFRCLSSTAACPADLANAMLACRRFCCIAMHPLVLVQAGSGALAVKASLWSDGADRFLKRCADFGNMEACYTLGMLF